MPKTTKQIQEQIKKKGEALERLQKQKNDLEQKIAETKQAINLLKAKEIEALMEEGGFESFEDLRQAVLANRKDQQNGGNEHVPSH
ncbi:TPA: hypothetical protein U1B12_001074 [Streptococcus suis]|uniref:hypothetical protein n=1 Tax=Streptococcus suis TaxID=1307 RepID=UPI00209AAB60|nr:hypothetical protein [Streptococcus suis]MCO8200852.1 hypothetical protein [Streptococcus suis]MCO8218389.1 hypothetical protein [Streptococcus suis]HEM3467939.1 hypothetical protein [Streptococcus suis]HEM3478650.1 hypothetical protein [Streptococcus suis]